MFIEKIPTNTTSPDTLSPACTTEPEDILDKIQKSIDSNIVIFGDDLPF